MRVNSVTAVNINLFFNCFKAPEVANIPLERFFNIDEIGIS